MDIGSGEHWVCVPQELCECNVKRFCSWLGLSPDPRMSAGKDLGARTKKCASHAANAFRQAAASVSRSDGCLGEFFRRMRTRKGGAEAITATAHKIAAIYYLTISRGEQYAEPDKSLYLQSVMRRRLKNLRRQAEKLGMSIVEEISEQRETQGHRYSPYAPKFEMK